MTAAPFWLQVLGHLAGLFAAFTIGWVVAWHRRGWREAWERACDIEAVASLASALVDAEDRARYLARQLVEAERIIRDLADARLYEAAQVGEVRAEVPPDVWRNLMEAREQPEAN